MATGGSSDSEPYSEGEEMSSAKDPGPSSSKKGKNERSVRVGNVNLKGDVNVDGNVSVGSMHAQNVVMNVVVSPTGANPIYRPSSQTDFADEALQDPEPFDDWAQSFAEADLCREVKDHYLAQVSQCVNEERLCRWLARKLEIDNPTVMSLRDSCGDKLPELAYQLMRKWKHTRGHVTITDLLNVLYMSRNNKAIDRLKEVLERKR